MPALYGIRIHSQNHNPYLLCACMRKVSEELMGTEEANFFPFLLEFTSVKSDLNPTGLRICRVFGTGGREPCGFGGYSGRAVPCSG